MPGTTWAALRPHPVQGRFGVPAGCFGVPGERYEGVVGVSCDVAAQLGEAWSRAVPEWA